MNHEILYQPSYSLARVTLEPGEEISAEAERWCQCPPASRWTPAFEAECCRV
jgi:uncharacterized protein (AIM24 family)